MMTVFVDTQYWIAVTRPNDSWAVSAKEAKSTLENPFLITTDEVLVEFLNAFASRGEHLRQTATKMVGAILDNPNVRVIPQSRDSFLRGIEFYKNRLDKAYSLTDCVSINTMKDKEIFKVLTNDHHFEQEGYEILMKKEQEKNV